MLCNDRSFYAKVGGLIGYNLLMCNCWNSTDLHSLSACLSLFLSIKPTHFHVFPPHILYVQVCYYSVLLVSCSSHPRSPQRFPLTLTVSPLYAYSNKGFMYCHNMINAVFAKGNYCSQKGRATHGVITTDHCSSCSACSATSPHPDREHRETDL